MYYFHTRVNFVWFSINKSNFYTCLCSFSISASMFVVPNSILPGKKKFLVLYWKKDPFFPRKGADFSKNSAPRFDRVVRLNLANKIGQLRLQAIGKHFPE